MTRERGSASLLVVACLSLLLLVTAALGVAGAMVRAHRTAQAAADLAALGGAAAGQRGGDACATAERLADANGARMTACRLAGPDVVVQVAVAGPRWLGQPHDLGASARAGPGSGQPSGPTP
ncbi:Rv3654c family TadE-like protein [Nocardioides coralli]|uniref:Rv3654c family TadE-like protein n=1 Tax=Nocardioides coralli TaxID=2872154 RepID=UPI001CA442A2|nr:Rv3654c family TadE-like protein [Nocardioides coralli]QZY29382.1 flp pilus-assembly TadE/G-like family protein [Nocardioides coralli]